MNVRRVVFAAVFTVATLADAAPMKVCVIQPPYAHDPAKAKRFLDMGVDTILTNDYQPISAATGLR